MKKITALTGLALLIALPGCSGGGEDVSFGAITGNLTPELRSVTERPEDIKAHMAYAQNLEWRNFWSDLGRVFYTDHPTRLSPYPVFDASGQPR